MADEQSAAANVKQIIAHRGASTERPECTLSAIQRAIETGATAVEMDVRTSRDGLLFILHDATLDRTTNGTGAANLLTLAELQQLDAGSSFDPEFAGERIPSLAEVAGACRGKIDLLLDLKEQGDEYDQQVASVIRQFGDPAKTIVGARSVQQAVRFRSLLPEARQLGLIPELDDIESFADAGVETIRLWPHWLNDGGVPVERVRNAGRQLHLNGTTGQLKETVDLLLHHPESLSSDDPAELHRSLRRIQEGRIPAVSLAPLIRSAEGSRLQAGESATGVKTFLNRDYTMLELPPELTGQPRYAFAGGDGHRIRLNFHKPTVIFAAFEYNNSGNWSFADGRSPADAGWHLWRENAYRGTSNPGTDDKPHRANIWYREFAASQTLSGMPPWWVCLAIMDVPSATTIDGFQPGLISDIDPPLPRNSPDQELAELRPLAIPEIASQQAFELFQAERRQLFAKRLMYQYSETPVIRMTHSASRDGIRQDEFHVELDGERLFRFFRLVSEKQTASDRHATIVCFMGHGKVKQLLEDTNSYQHACALQFARAGYLVYAMENVGMEPDRDVHLDLDQSLRLEGHGWYSLLFTHQRFVLDHVFEDPQVDPERVGVTGVSTGGLLTLSAVAMDPRIAAASVQGIFGSMRVSFIQDRQRHCSCGAIPGLLPEFDLPELALLAAPRPLQFSNGRTDGFSPQEAQRCVQLITPLYTRPGGSAPEITISPGGHEFNLPAALEFFHTHLTMNIHE
ncbi:MAG: acetylxylan esterase [Planctomycetaceae bacterium]|nr:acetylxylan esterase [Planctomycetaceae bacterium]